MAMTDTISRRHFLQLGTASLLVPGAARLPAPASARQQAPLRMGVIADLHHGLDPRALERLESFMQAVDERQPDCIVQLGDFNYGTPPSRACMRLWQQFDGPRYHVLGNHDMDFTTKEEMLAFWSMPDRYYAFDRGGYHFVVLDRNNLKTADGYIPYARANFYVDAPMRAHADPDQLEWLRADLAATELPTVVFVHQGLGMQHEPYAPGDPCRAIETIFEHALREDGSSKVVACFCGHHHLDRYAVKKGIPYVWLNSASYYWVGEEYGRMAPYKDALYTFLTFHPDGWIEVAGCRTEWEAPTPHERGYPQAADLTPYITHRRMPVTINAATENP